MTSLPHLVERYVLHSEDLPEDVFRQMAGAKQLAWDLETTGLDWKTNGIALCQVHSDTGLLVLVRIGDRVPTRLARLLADNGVKKIFHHAMFDLRFMAHHWRVSPRNIACTKIASKLLFPEQPEVQHLQTLLQRFLGVTIDKSEQMSPWKATNYSPSQIAYAVRDVLYLFDLYEALTRELERLDRLTLAEQCFAHIPTRVALEVAGLGDVFSY